MSAHLRLSASIAGALSILLLSTSAPALWNADSELFNLTEDKVSFQTEIENDLEAYRNGTLSNWSYLGMSLYHENIKRYAECFGKNGQRPERRKDDRHHQRD